MARCLTRRGVLVAGAGALAAGLTQPGDAAAGADGEIESHGISSFDDLKYPPGFTHFDYVNPDAPKGGVFSQIGSTRQYNQNFLTFNTLNGYILKGDAALGIESTFASLMSSSGDEPDGMYGLAARAVRISADKRTYRFLLRPQLRFHDGSPLTAHDIAFSLAILKEQGYPIIRQLLRFFEGADAEDDATLVARFAEDRPRDVPLFVASLPIFSRAYYSKRPFDETTLDPPLGSGPYKVGRFDVGRYIEYERVKDWWGADLPVSRGTGNFDILRYEYYREREAAFQAFTGKNYLFREEFTSRVWATRYNFPAIRDGRVKQEELPDERPSGAQGWFFNTRREKFKNRGFRDALNYAFDFEWTNRNIMYGSYQRTHSAFQNSDLMANGKPGPEELAILEPFRSRIPEEVFGEPFVPPASDGSGQDRALLREATRRLQAAGYAIKDRKLVDPAGQPVTIEFLIDDPTFEPHHQAFIKNLGILGISASIRRLEAVEYKRRQDTFDFDIIVERMGFGLTPGDSLRPYFSSQAASTPGSYNIAGIADPVVDALIEKVIAANSRPELVTACRALDRVLRAGRYWIPHWYKPSFWLAYWDVFSHPAAKPRYDRGAPATWWYDADRAAKLERG